ncbi:MAG: hypothetical protein M3461_22890 [Pseudomonadota bacterium]|nr:hypothetical protein [Pseudomonadota bacterium]
MRARRVRLDAAGDIPLGTVEAFEQAAVARDSEDLREHFEERAGIYEHDAGLPRPEAGIEAAQILLEVSSARCWKGNNWFDMEITHEKSSHGLSPWTMRCR